MVVCQKGKVANLQELPIAKGGKIEQENKHWIITNKKYLWVYTNLNK